jgi:hypothetical protein
VRPGRRKIINNKAWTQKTEAHPMTTSSKKNTHEAPKPSAEHWNELIAILPEQTVEQFAEWMDEQLASLDADLQKYVTRVSLRKNLRG